MDGDRELIRFSMGTKKPRNRASVCTGKLRNKLCRAGLDGELLKVWSISEKSENQCVIEHRHYMRISMKSMILFKRTVLHMISKKAHFIRYVGLDRSHTKSFLCHYFLFFSLLFLTIGESKALLE